MLLRLLLLLLVTLAAASAVQAQAYTGVTVERFGPEAADLTTVTVRHSGIGRAGFGPELALGLAPVSLPHLTIEMDAGLAWRLPLRPATVLIKAGPAGFLQIPELELHPGLMAGGALLVPLAHRLHLRADVARRVYFPEGRNPVGVWSVGVGFAVRAPSLRAAGTPPSRSTSGTFEPGPLPPPAR